MQSNENDGVVARPGEYLSFRLGAEEYGVPILAVQEIRSYSIPTRIANAPFYVKGVVNLRGVIVPILDMRIKIGQEATYTETTATIVLNVAGRVVGMVVDSVSDVVALASEQIKPPPQMGSRLDASYVTGIATQTVNEADRMLILVQVERLLSIEDIEGANSERVTDGLVAAT